MLTFCVSMRVMSSTLALIHLSDTHFALPHEQLSVPGLLRRPLPVGGFLGGVFKLVRRLVVSNHAAQPAEQALVRAMHSAITTTATILRAAMGTAEPELDDAAIVHTGDLTQAGQIESMKVALDAFSASGKGLPFYGQIGNHDMWPANFPPFAPERIPQQHQWTRGLRSNAQTVTLPARYPAIDSLGPASEVQLVRLNSVLGDSLPNTVAWGAVADEHDPSQPIGTSSSQFNDIPVSSRNVRLRAAMMHHPPFSLHTGIIAAASHIMVSPAWCGLIDGARVQAELLRRGVNLVLCGHEHQRSAQRIFADSRILQLATGSPAFRKGRGNHDVPHFSLHWIDVLDDAVYVWWCVCVLASVGGPSWGVEGVYKLDRATSIWSEIQVPALYPTPLDDLITRLSP
jgi:3',5'-cyclic AMP phosphodiesterase CpdA